MRTPMRINAWRSTRKALVGIDVRVPTGVIANLEQGDEERSVLLERRLGATSLKLLEPEVPLNIFFLSTTSSRHWELT